MDRVVSGDKSVVFKILHLLELESYVRSKVEGRWAAWRANCGIVG